MNFLADEMGADVRNYQPLDEKNHGLYPDNMVLKNFKEMGYKIINFNTFALHLHEIPLADHTICHRQPFLLDNRLVDTLGRTSVAGYFVERWAEAELRQATKCALDELSLFDFNSFNFSDAFFLITSSHFKIEILFS